MATRQGLVDKVAGLHGFSSSDAASLVDGASQEGASNSRMGIVTLSGGTAVVPTTAVTANTRIFLTINVPGAGTEGHVIVSARVAGTSFTILSSSGDDVSQVAWRLVEPLS